MAGDHSDPLVRGQRRHSLGDAWALDRSRRLTAEPACDTVRPSKTVPEPNALLAYSNRDWGDAHAEPQEVTVITRLRTSAILGVVVAMLMMLLPGIAVADKPARKDRPPAEFDENGTPLEKAIKESRLKTAGKNATSPATPKRISATRR